MTSKLKMHSPDLTEDNIAKIAALFPNCISESRDEQGRLKQVVDFDLLRQELSDVIVEGEQERYRLDWVGKKEAILTANAPIAKTLRPSREESVNFDTTENLFIEGDNLDALKLLQENYLGKVKMIYIDPPYNTGKDFIYNDDFAESSAEFFARSQQFDEEGNRLIANTESNGRFHSDWLSMMYSRLKLARNLLADDGVIFISCDDNEIGNLKKAVSEIFGSYNHIAQFPWQSRQSIQNDTDISINHEYVLAFAKNRRQENRRLKEGNVETWFKEKSFVCNPLPLDKEKFDNPDNDPRGLWKADPFDAPNVRLNLTYPIVNPNTGEEYYPPKGRCWRTEQKNYERLLADGRILFGKTGNSRPQLKVFYAEKKMFGSVDNSWWTGERCGTTTQGTKEIISLFESPVFDTPKPVALLNNLLKLATRDNEENIILDFFAGSATTAHAVMQLNAEDGGNRRFIMVQLPEATDEKSEAFKAGYPTIAEISKERIRRAAAKIHDDFADKLPEDWDGGFRVLKVDSTNMKDVYYRPDEVSQSDLLDMVSHIKEDRSGEDLLFQVMLDWGLPLSLSIQERDVDGKKVYFVGEKSSLGYALAACFDELNEAVIQAVAAETPQKFVSVEYAISQDADKTNIKEWFKQLSPETDVKFI
mgnify:CR=1 FL=1|jgi:hypothetical protein